MIGKEHSIQDDGTYSGSDDAELLNAQVCYNQISDTKYTPRSIFVDLDSRSSDEVLGGQLGKLFSLDDFVCGIGGTQGNWAKGFYTDGNDLSGRNKYAFLWVSITQLLQCIKYSNYMHSRKLIVYKNIVWV